MNSKTYGMVIENFYVVEKLFMIIIFHCEFLWKPDYACKHEKSRRNI